jgi:hypothetical protein
MKRGNQRHQETGEKRVADEWSMHSEFLEYDNYSECIESKQEKNIKVSKLSVHCVNKVVETDAIVEVGDGGF